MKLFLKRILIVLIIINNFSFGQNLIRGNIIDNKHNPIKTEIQLIELNKSIHSDSAGNFSFNTDNIRVVTLLIDEFSFEKFSRKIQLSDYNQKELVIKLHNIEKQIEEIVVSGTLKAVSKSASSVPIEVYSHKFFKANPAPSLFESLQTINGVKPQINCSVCNTGDIHINGLEGPYTMILIDGMPIVSGLSTVYGLSGIPQALIDRIEIVKGPASTLYGSEAVGGLINVITKKTQHAPIFGSDIFTTSWGELNADVNSKFSIGKKAESLLGVNYFNYNNPIDNNHDNFTDVALQNRISVFNKINIDRKDNKLFSIAGRYVYEDRWGGEMNWNKTFRGGDSIYGESIYTSRWEIFGTYDLPTKENISFQYSANAHNQNSVYGNTKYIANQKVFFGQLKWDKQINKHQLLSGITFRNTIYDDNTPATFSNDTLNPINQIRRTYLPGIFFQDEVEFNKNHKLLFGIRYDYNSIHGNILTPRLNYKFNILDKKNTVRLSFGNGYRIVNVFTEDHSALTGARKVIFNSELKPETSWNGNVNYVRNFHTKNGAIFNIDATAFYTHFSNKIIPDYESNPNQIIYDNLSGYAISKGGSINFDFTFPFGLKMNFGGTFMDVYSMENNIKERQLFTEKFTSVWNIAYKSKKYNLTIDYTGNVYSSMRLPMLNEFDPRSDFSPVYSIQNIQVTKTFSNGFEIYVGIKNLLNWTPFKSVPFLIARAFDPFDKNVQFDTNGQVVATTNNPYALTFDPTYIYASNQGIRFFGGIRFTFK